MSADVYTTCLQIIVTILLLHCLPRSLVRASIIYNDDLIGVKRSPSIPLSSQKPSIKV